MTDFAAAPDYIPFNRPHLVGTELTYMQDAVGRGKLSGNGHYTQLCQHYLETHFGCARALLTTSGSAALDMMALLLDVQPGDEVIVPSYTFTSSANAFALRGARIVFADSRPDHPNLDADRLRPLITPRTRGIVAVHYAGDACDLAALQALAQEYGLWLVEDAAQAIESRWQGRLLGTFGQLGALSFHETKNLSAGEGGALLINDPQLAARAEIIWEKGTNRAAFARGEAARYEWVDVGSSFLPSELNAAYLWAQLEHTASIQARRQLLWQRYHEALHPLVAAGCVGYGQPLPDSAPNWHLFYLICRDQAERDALIGHLAARHILAVFHYVPLHASPYHLARHAYQPLPQAERFGRCLVRLPLFHDLSPEQQQRVIDGVRSFYAERSASTSA